MAAVLRYVTHARPSATGTLFVLCHVRPRTSKMREGVTAMTDDAVEICVAAPPRNGEANKAVINVLHRVCWPPPLFCFLALTFYRRSIFQSQESKFSMAKSQEIRSLPSPV